MKLLVEGNITDFNIGQEIRNAIEELKNRTIGTMAQNCNVTDNDVFLYLANKYSNKTFILLDNDNKIIGWRN